MFPIIPENAPKTRAAIAKTTPKIISKIPKTVMPDYESRKEWLRTNGFNFTD